MDDNVSRNTFSVKFLKFCNQGRNLIKESLTQNLKQAIASYRQTQDIAIDLKSIYTALDRKIAPLFSQPSNIIYRCTIAFTLAKYFPSSPEIIARKLVALLPVADSSIAPSLEFQVIAIAGRIDFCCDDSSLASWLDWAVAALSSRQPHRLDSLSLKKGLTDVFPIQYVHARCCSWLRLGASEGSIELSDGSFTSLVWQIAHPQPLSWLNAQGDFYLTTPAAYGLLFQLLIAIDKLNDDSENWLKMAFNLSEAMLVFEAESQIFGTVEKLPQRAIACLGLVALVQYCLQQLLVSKLNVAALTKL